jgi:hypothetical protein
MTYKEMTIKYMTPPEAERFLMNIREHQKQARRSTVGYCIDFLLAWEFTPEGYEYWEDLYYKYRNTQIEE